MRKYCGLGKKAAVFILSLTMVAAPVEYVGAAQELPAVSTTAEEEAFASVSTANVDKSLLAALDKVIRQQKITSSTSKFTALKKLFAYCSGKSFDYARAYGFKGEKGWEYKYAKEMLSKKKGSCYHFSAAFALLAKRATGLPVRICWGTSNAFNKFRWQPHAWVEIKIGSTWYTYDPNAQRFSSLRKGKWYQQKHSSMAGKVYKVKKYVNIAEMPKTSSSNTTAVKSGLKKEKGKYYYYYKGKKLVNKWKTVTITVNDKKYSYQYYFGSDGAAYAGTVKDGMKFYAVKKIKNYYYGFDEKGHMLKGLQYINGKNYTGKFYMFNSKTGVYDRKVSLQVNKAAGYKKPASTLQKLLNKYAGKPKKTEKNTSCYGDGWDISCYYNNFIVGYYRSAEGKEIVMGIASV